SAPLRHQPTDGAVQAAVGGAEGGGGVRLLLVRHRGGRRDQGAKMQAPVPPALPRPLAGAPAGDVPAVSGHTAAARAGGRQGRRRCGRRGGDGRLHRRAAFVCSMVDVVTSFPFRRRLVRLPRWFRLRR
ncbi:hypothetical protein MUK42_06487, partial [Musa troglodytarum]